MRYEKSFTIEDKDLTIPFWELSNYSISKATDGMNAYITLKGFLTEDAKKPIVSYRVVESFDDCSDKLGDIDALLTYVMGKLNLLDEQEVMFEI